MEQTNSKTQNEDNEGKQQQNQGNNKGNSLDASPKKRNRTNKPTKKEKKELKKQQNIKEGKVEPKPQEIQYEPVLNEMITLPDGIEETNGITIMTYNLLAQSLCNRKHFPNCGDSLKWKNRRPRLIKEIFHYLPDIGCFQEMDDTNYNDTFKPEFEKSGYDTLFYKGDHIKRHGCCIAWKKSKFTKLKESTFDFDKIGVPTMVTNCIGIIVALGILNKKESKGVVIGTTHLYWRPESMYERTRQCLILYQNLLKVNEEFNFPAFLAGDFNSTPHDPIYQLMVNKSKLSENEVSKLEISMRAFEEKSNEGVDNVPSTPVTNKDNDEVTIEQSKISQSFIVTEDRASQLQSSHSQSSQSQQTQIQQLQQNLSSPSLKPQLEPLSTLLSNFEKLPKCLSLYGQYYHLIDSENIEHSEPKITNYGEYFKGTLDYIFFVLNQKGDVDENGEINNNNVKITKLLKLPRKEEFGSTSLPNYKFNSDHICLMVEVRIE
ncbi:Endonuclease/exonuclease/phosphatase [Rhizophagus diaphanus]|nr:Endonuclease/exonuclease/phosphatase [Rhizophagus diaphanus] [Rhizophagus sp. MUCL 43196]